MNRQERQERQEKILGNVHCQHFLGVLGGKKCDFAVLLSVRWRSYFFFAILVCDEGKCCN